MPHAIRLDGLDADALAVRWGLPMVVLRGRVDSTMDDAHAAAGAGADAGTVIIAEEQRAGRGRSGGKWDAMRGSAVLLTLIERPGPGPALDVLSLRIGLALATSLGPFADVPLRVKWPNDVYDAAGKLAGVLIEIRWRDQQPEWVAIGIGVNLAVPHGVTGSGATASALRPGSTRLAVLDALLPALRAVVRQEGALTAAELDDWARRDLLLGRPIRAPAAGIVAGIAPTGDLLVDTASGRIACRSGSVAF
jgi:BirA family transcriptional regulator, biotin operon repressor / biotin---[acetyl-CoA-carboxylase] ligase